MTARLRLPDVKEKGRPKRRPIPDHVPRMKVELSPATEASAGSARTVYLKRAIRRVMSLIMAIWRGL